MGIVEVKARGEVGLRFNTVFIEESADRIDACR